MRKDPTTINNNSITNTHNTINQQHQHQDQYPQLNTQQEMKHHNGHQTGNTMNQDHPQDTGKPHHTATISAIHLKTGLITEPISAIHLKT